MYKPIEIADGIYSVGCRDWDIRDFHGYSTYEGTTYNAFLVLGEKNVLIDTVKEKFSDELLSNISRIIDPKKIDILISNHTEMDHSGTIPKLMQIIGKDKPLYCSKMGAKNLKSHFNRDFNFHSKTPYLINPVYFISIQYTGLIRFVKTSYAATATSKPEASKPSGKASAFLTTLNGRPTTPALVFALCKTRTGSPASIFVQVRWNCWSPRLMGFHEPSTRTCITKFDIIFLLSGELGLNCTTL